MSLSFVHFSILGPIVSLLFFFNLRKRHCSQTSNIRAESQTDDDTLDSIQLWSETLALLERWDKLAEVYELLETAQETVNDTQLARTLRQIEKLRGFERQTS